MTARSRPGAFDRYVSQYLSTEVATITPDLRHGVAMEVYEPHHDLEQVCGLLGHTRLETVQFYAKIRPAARGHQRPVPPVDVFTLP